uniref:Uncharacterized protein n=1 Tax=Oryza punctata TaxID=4537 RepID=A0A0E0JE56_ORYPU
MKNRRTRRWHTVDLRPPLWNSVAWPDGLCRLGSLSRAAAAALVASSGRLAAPLHGGSGFSGGCYLQLQAAGSAANGGRLTAQRRTNLRGP